jgi:N-acetylmuramoyl-L-alanine amidase
MPSRIQGVVRKKGLGQGMARGGNAIVAIFRRAKTAALALPFLLVSATAPMAQDMLSPELLASYVASSDFRLTEERKALASQEIYCLGQAVYHESRGEPDKGQWAVASVILNRVESRQYPGTVCGVVFQNAHMPHRCQFSFACDGRPDDGGHGNLIDRESWVKSHLVARIAYNKYLRGLRHEEGLTTAMHFHTTSVQPNWASSYVAVATIGAHIFY